MEKLPERLQTPISTAELERRWAAVRAAMEREKIDALLMQNNNDYMGGYVKYFTDLPATNGYPLTVVFPRDDLMTMVSQGPFGGASNPAASSDGTRRGVKQWLTTPSFVSCNYTASLRRGIGGEGTWSLMPAARSASSAPPACRLRWSTICRKGRFSNTRFVDATDLVDTIKVIKSAEEQELIRRCAAMQDGAMRAAFAAVEPGMRDRDIAAIAQCYSQRHGSENGIYLCASMPADTPAQFSQRHYQNRVIQKGDTLALLGRGFRTRRHVYRARPVLRRRQGIRRDQGRIRLCARSAQIQSRACSSPARPARTSLPPITISCARTAGRKRNGCTATARATTGRAAADPQRRADVDPKRHEHRGASDLYPRPRVVLGLRQLSDRRERTGRAAASLPGRITELVS